MLYQSLPLLPWGSTGGSVCGCDELPQEKVDLQTEGVKGFDLIVDCILAKAEGVGWSIG